ncbi:MBL fold metallo-hydrolase [Chryseobacterium aureum]|uniref:MBL fold metallo-hydrolase n=1 Tax=Chryseobacterium aureum TaxID=2497456 RepID=UPI000F871E85|nr:MBL fold metallo-hydrolase [Chryseobacterium aureum]
MKSFTIFLALMITLGSCNAQKTAKTGKALKVTVFKGHTATVNSYIFSNGKSQIVMDVLRSSEEAKQLAQQIKAAGLPLTHILITHGHPDHYIGMDILHKAFPEAKIVVASPEIKNDIKNFSLWMESLGWLDGEVNLKPKSNKNPNGFDYENAISVLSDDQLKLNGGGILELKTKYDPAEAEHLTTVYSKDLNALFTSDFCYNKVHLWLGTGVDHVHIQNWKNQLAALKTKYAKTNPVIYPGHGDTSDISLFTTVTKYIENFERVTAGAKTKKEAMEAMKKLYPDWKQDDFLLLYSVDYHVKE